MRTSKRTLAGVAAGALALGMLTVASASTASAAPSIKPKATVSATASAVRPTGTSSPLSIAPARLTWTGASSFTPNGTGTSTGATITLLTAPSATAKLTIDDTTATDDTVSLQQPTADIGVNYVGSNYDPTGDDDSKVYFNVDTAGTYSGRIANGTDTVNFSFSTAGAPTSLTLTPTTQTVQVGAVATVTATLKDSLGNVTQPQTIDSITVGSSSTSDTVAFTTISGAAGSASSLQLGTFDDTIATQAAGTSTITATPLGTLPGSGVTAATATVVKSGTINTVVAKSIKVTAPTNALQLPSTVTNSTDTVVRTYQVPELTTSLTVVVDDTTANAAGSNIRLEVTPSAGTVNGSTSAVYINLTTDANRQATTTLTLGGAAVIASSNVTIRQVNVLNVPIAPSLVTVTQKTPVVSATGVTVSPQDSQVAALGATTPVTVTVTDDSFSIPQVGYAVSSVRGTDGLTGTILNTATTNSSGIATVNVTSASTAVNGTVEQYSFRITPPTATAFAANNKLQITYTTSGGINTLYVNAFTGSNVSDTVAATTIPAILTPGILGYADDSGGATPESLGIYTISTGVTSPAANSTITSIAPVASPATNVTVTPGAGVYLFTTKPTVNSTLFSAGSTTAVTVASGTKVYIVATTVGTSTVTVTAGGKSATQSIRVSNNAARAYNIAVSPATASVATSAFFDATVTVTDMFGNIVDTDDTYAVTATTTGQVRLASGATTSTTITTGSAGTATVGLTASGSAGAGTLTLTPTTTTAGAWASTGYTPPTGIAAPVKSAVSTITVTAPAVPIPTTITWGTVPASVNAGSITTLEGTLKDQNGAVMDDQDVNIVITGSATIGTSGIKTGQVTTNAAGKFFVGALAGASGTFTVTATADLNVIATATTSSVTITAAPTPATITVLPAGGGVVPSSVAAGSSVPMVATVKDTTGAAEANEAVEVSITGNATFANGNTQYVANTGAAGTLGFTVIAGASGTFTVTATVVSAPAVTASAGPITITAAPVTKTITIMGGRGEGADPVPSGETCRSVAEAGEELPDRCVTADGETTGFSTGSAMTPEFRFPGQTSYSPGTAVNTDADGAFDWFRKTGKKIYVKFSSAGVESNRIIIDAR